MERARIDIFGRTLVLLGLLVAALLWPAGGAVQARDIVDAEGAALAGPGPAAAPEAPYIFSITRSGAAATLKWYSASDCTDYEVWRGVAAYFDPAAGQGNKIAEFTNIWGELGTAAYTDDGVDRYSAGPSDPLLATVQVIGNVNINYFWVVRGLNGDGVSENSNRVGEFDFRLAPGS